MGWNSEGPLPYPEIATMVRGGLFYRCLRLRKVGLGETSLPFSLEKIVLLSADVWDSFKPYGRHF